MSGPVTAELGYLDHPYKEDDGRELHYHADLPVPLMHASDMGPDEVLVFKSFDSDPARASHVPHCAFRGPSQPAGAARVSIEARIWGAFR